MRTFEASRDIPASVADVFAAIEDPARLARWWGPDGFTNTFDVCEFTNGGRWLLTMHGPGDTHYPGEYAFERIERPHTIVVRHVSEPHFRLTIALAPSATGTRVSWLQAFDDDNVANAMERIVVPANNQNLARLAAEVADRRDH